MGRGMWRDGEFVQVNYHDLESIPITKKLYQQRGYEPPYAELPTKEEYETRDASD